MPSVSQRDGGPKRVLYVDDEEALATLGAELLADNGVQVVCAFSGFQALKIFEQHSGAFDLVVTDECMPGMTGVELARKLAEIAPDLPVVLCSGHLLSLADEGIDATNIVEVLAKTDAYLKLPGLMEKLFPSR